MKNNRNYIITLALFNYVFLIVLLLRTGTIRMLINPRLSFLTVIALILLSIMCLNSMRLLCKKSHHQHGHHIEHGHGHECHCCNHTGELFKSSDFLLILPLFLLFMIPPQVLSYHDNNTFSKNSIVQQQSSTVSNGWDGMNHEPTKIPTRYPAYSQLDIGNMLFKTSDAPSPEKLLGTMFFLEGTVLTSPVLNPGEIVIYRYAMVCCAADGVPLGVVVKLPEGIRFQDKDWVGVEGSLQLLPYESRLKTLDPVTYLIPPEQVYPVFTATKAYKISTPQDFYLYP